MSKKIKKVTKKKKATAKKESKPSGIIKSVGNSLGKAPKLKNPVTNYGYREIFVSSEYDLSQISLIEDGESYVRQAFQKKTALMFKEGEIFSGKNEETIKYIKTRIRQIEFVTGIPWRSLLRMTGKELISKSNFFWVKVRKASASGGTVGHKKKKPIAGYFPMPAETVFIRKDKDGVIIKYKQILQDGRWMEFDPEDVIHFKTNVKPGLNFGTPQIIPVIPDIQALRRLEENVEVLFYQTLFPVFQYKVGTESKPASTITLPDGQVMDEIEYVRYQIQNMPSEGGIVTPERHEVKYIGANGQIPDYQSTLAYFKSRVLAGLGISGLDIGDSDTANRSTADSLSKALIDSVKDYQAQLEEIINAEVIMELLLEGDFNFDPLTEDNFVSLKFKEIDIEEQMKKNVNAQLLYNSDMIDINEARQESGRQPLEESQEDFMFTARQTLRVLDEQTKAQKSLASHGASLQPTTEKTSTTTGGGKRNVTKTKTTPSQKAKAAQNSGKNKNAPTNQHGTKTGPQKSRLDSFIENEKSLLSFFESKYGKDSTMYQAQKIAANNRLKKRVDLINDKLEQEEYKKISL